MYPNTVYRAEVEYYTTDKEPWEPIVEIVEYVKDFVRHSRYVEVCLPALRTGQMPETEEEENCLSDFFDEQLLQHINEKRDGHRIELHCDGILLTGVSHQFHPMGPGRYRPMLTVVVYGANNAAAKNPMCSIHLHFLKQR